MMKLSFSTLGNPTKPLEEFAQQLSAAGYEGVELRGRQGAHVHWQDSPARRQEVRKLFADVGMEIVSVSSYIMAANRDARGPDKPDHRDEAGNIEELKRVVDLASDLGARNVRIFGGRLTPGETHEDAIPRLARVMQAGAKANPGINIALEAHDDWGTGELLGRVLDLAAMPNAKALLDVAGPKHAGETPETTVRHLRPERIAYLHVKDAFPMPGQQGEYECFIGAGDWPVEETIALLKKAGWSGYLNVEWEAFYHDYMPPCEVAMVQAAEKLRQWMAP